ncbi:Crp/Fnr family transcriptional regulator [Anaerosalibacter bizertensis]|uniref:Crp/Fnr family transcriptional regulator n=1 Tax=Anaerosalibacter bizertensis TaxID=932217 RepID=UPI001EDB1173|nr:Crp/Fnr family transcriptional regulator [Bacteroidales bacterium MSK.15.36]MCG4581507.1 Crp/Fnr family transcriptional regulator [Anaerosalibacter bizertensis]
MTINKYKELISHTYLFNNFSPDEINKLFKYEYYQIKNYKKNSIIYIQNEKCSTVDILLNGTIAVQRIGENGDVLTVATFSSGDIIGGNLAFSNNNEYPMTIISASNSEILHIKRGFILELCQNNKAFLVRFLHCLSDKTLVLTDTIKFISMKSIRDKIIEFLTYEYYTQKDLNIKLNISKKELAEKFGIQRPSLFRELRKMKEEKLIDYNHKYITILDKSILK